MKITKSEAIFNHRKMWHWIADETRSFKRKVEKWEYFFYYMIPDDDIPLQDCYCCEYDKQLHLDKRYLNGGYSICTHCPIDWGWGAKCHDSGTLWGQWYDCSDEDWEFAAELADKIAELPERHT